MALDKPMDDLKESDLLDLIEQGMSERKIIDYKSWLELDTIKKKKDFCADVSSFANTIGGHLVYGMKEKGGVPTGICGIDIPNREQYIAQMEAVLRSRISPRIPGYEIQAIPVLDNRYAIVVRIPQSFRKPHQIEGENEEYHFYARNSNGNYRLVVDELRSIFLQSEALEDRIRYFREDRLANIIAEEGAMLMEDGPKVVYHIIPISAFASRQNYDLKPVLSGVNGVAVFGGHYRYNLEGVLFHAPPVKIEGRLKTVLYAQVFRHGVIEAVDGYGLSGGGTEIAGRRYDDRIMKHVHGLLQDSYKLGVVPPVIVMVSLIGVQGWTITGDGYMAHQYGKIPIQRDVLQLPDVQVADNTTPLTDIMQPALDALWNSAGWERSMSYDESGVWLNGSR